MRPTHILLLALIISSVLMSTYVMAQLKKPDIDDIDATVTESTINRFDYRDWKPQELAHIQPTVLALMDKAHAKQYFENKLPPIGFYKPQFAHEAIVYTTMTGIDASFKDLVGTEFGKKAIKFGERVVGFNPIATTDIMIRQSPKGLSVEGIEFAKGEVFASRDALLFHKGSSFKGNGFEVENSVNQINVKGGCGAVTSICIKETEQYELKDGSVSSAEEVWEKSPSGVDYKDLSERKSVLSITPIDNVNRPNEDIIIEDGKFDRINIEYHPYMKMQGAPITLRMRAQDGSLTPIFIQNGNVWIAPGEVPVFQSKITVFNAVPSYMKNVLMEGEAEKVEVFSISNGEVRKDGILVSH